MHPQERLISGRYRLLTPAGSDALGILWRANDEQRRTDVWVRELLLPSHLTPAERAAIAARVAASARGSAILSHPAFLPVLDVTEDGGGVFVITKAVPGQNLRQLVAAGGPLPPDRAARLGLDILAALDAAHTLGMVHDGLSPSTVYVTPEGGVVLTDFGLAATTEVATGTPLGGSPGEENLSGPARDLFDLGGTLYFAVEGVEAAYPRPAPKRAGALLPVLHGLLILNPDQRWNSEHVESSLRKVAGKAGPVTMVTTPAPDGTADPATATTVGPAQSVSAPPRSAAAAVDADPLASVPKPETVIGKAPAAAAGVATVSSGPPASAPSAPPASAPASPPAATAPASGAPASGAPASSPAEVPPGPPYPPPPAKVPAPAAVPPPGFAGGTGGFPVVPPPGSPPHGYAQRRRPRWVWAVTSVVIVVFLAVTSVGVILLNRSEQRTGPGDGSVAGPPGAQPTGASPVALNLKVPDNSAYGELLDQYQKDHPNVTVRVVEVPQSEYVPMLMAELQSGSDPGDLVLLDEDQFWQVADTGKLADLAPLAGDVANDYLPWAYEFGRAAGGEVYGLPADAAGLALCYRQDLLRAGGLPQDRTAVANLWPTWEAFVAAGRQYRQNTGKPLLDNVTTVYSAMALQQGEPIYFDRSDKLVADTSGSVRYAWEKSVEMYALGISARVQAGTDTWDRALATGAFAVTACDVGTLRDIRTMSGPAGQGVWNITPIPGGSGNSGGTWIAVPQQSRHQVEAATLAKFLTSAESQATLARKTGKVPTSTGALAETPAQADLAPYFNNAPIGSIFADSVRTMRPVYRGPKYQDVGTFAFQAALAQMENGQLTPEAAWQQAMAEARRRATS